jgi:hypothetical protein
LGKNFSPTGENKMPGYTTLFLKRYLAHIIKAKIPFRKNNILTERYIVKKKT